MSVLELRLFKGELKFVKRAAVTADERPKHRVLLGPLEF